MHPGFSRYKLYLASANPGKLREFRHAALTRGIEVEALPGIAALPVCIEDGETFEANALKKAIHYSRHTESLVFADDSGLCVDALGGAPGVYSARFAGPNASDKSNNEKLLREMEKLPQSSRQAHYVCVIALAKQQKILTAVEGRVDGKICSSARGDSGFGYDPYFFYTPLGKTFAELTLEDKFAVSHRGIAFRRMLDYLESNPSTI